MAQTRLRDVLDSLESDSFREEYPFSREILEPTKSLLEAVNDDVRSAIIGQWLMQHQTCIFGKLAAARGLITFCFITDDDLRESDDRVVARIQAARREWKSLGEHGKRSAFIILAISPTLVQARPDEKLMRFATDLASLYLRTDVIPDRVYTDSIDLWNLRFDIGRRWGVGVNVFAIQGDRRWWHDHRIPGGLAFSMNSVGHMVAAEARRTAIIQAQKTVSELKASTKTVKLNKLEAEMAQLAQTSIHSLDHALKFAMHTINNASYEEDTVCPWWPKATSLMREGPDSRCPIPLVAADPVLNGMNWTTYLGWYHTDITVPSEYFQIDQSRPKSIKVPLALDFSYLHSKRELDFKKLAQGKLIKERARIRRIARAQKTS